MWRRNGRPERRTRRVRGPRADTGHRLPATRHSAPSLRHRTRRPLGAVRVFVPCPGFHGRAPPRSRRRRVDDGTSAAARAEELDGHCMLCRAIPDYPACSANSRAAARALRPRAIWRCWSGRRWRSSAAGITPPTARRCAGLSATAAAAAGSWWSAAWRAGSTPWRTRRRWTPAAGPSACSATASASSTRRPIVLLYERVCGRGPAAHRVPAGRAAQRRQLPPAQPADQRPGRVTVVVEAAAGSGALITADAALEPGREVMAVPGTITSPTSVGTNRLIRDGAAPVLEPADLLGFYPEAGGRSGGTADGPIRTGGQGGRGGWSPWRRSNEPPHGRTAEPDLTLSHRAADARSDGDGTRHWWTNSRLGRQIPVPEALSALFTLELAGRVEQGRAGCLRGRVQCGTSQATAVPRVRGFHASSIRKTGERRREKGEGRGEGRGRTVNSEQLGCPLAPGSG